MPPRPRLSPLLIALALLLAACGPQPAPVGQVRVQLTADGLVREVTVPGGSTVNTVLQAAGVIPGASDRVEPPLASIVQEGSAVRLIRVREEFEVVQVTLPFDQQVVRNETLPEGETRLIQPGANGQQEETVRRVYEDNLLVSETVVKITVLQAALPEIVMVGAQTAFAPLSIPGVLVYLSGGNAWWMDGSTAERRPLVTTGDLDGRIFSLSPDGRWLLFTRRSTKPADREINTLWAVRIRAGAAPFSLRVSNVVHYAGWAPGQEARVYYSTVEPRTAAPGWQANNDLSWISFIEGTAYQPHSVVDVNAGGIYGWWGTWYGWSPDGTQILYARPDSVGMVDTVNAALLPLVEITPLQTRSDWAWIPPAAWGADSRTIYLVSHAPPPSLVSAEESPYFDLSTASLSNSARTTLAEQVGMFAYPSTSPKQRGDEGQAYQVAWLQAIFAAQSGSSRYRLVVMDRDGSNRHTFFPAADAPGLDPQTPVWAPEPVSGQDGLFIAVIYQGNLWLIDSLSGEARQITGDGLMARVDWK